MVLVNSSKLFTLLIFIVKDLTGIHNISLCQSLTDFKLYSDMGKVNQKEAFHLLIVNSKMKVYDPSSSPPS